MKNTPVIEIGGPRWASTHRRRRLERECVLIVRRGWILRLIIRTGTRALEASAVGGFRGWFVSVPLFEPTQPFVSVLREPEGLELTSEDVNLVNPRITAGRRSGFTSGWRGSWNGD